MATYHGTFRNAAEDFVVRSGAELITWAQDEATEIEQPEAHLNGDYEIDPDLYYVAVEEKVMCLCGCPRCDTVLRTRYRLHTSHISGRWEGSPDGEDMDELIDSIRERSEEDYDDYLENNRHAIVQMERYEMFRNEY